MTGDLGEKIAARYIEQKLGRTVLLTHAKVSPATEVDFSDSKGRVYEIKAGQASNVKTAQHWRVSRNGKPSDKDAAWLKKATKQQVKDYWDAKIESSLAEKRKYAKERGVTGKTICLIINNDKKVADLHVFTGFHRRIVWTSEQAKKGYVGSFRYGS